MIFPFYLFSYLVFKEVFAIVQFKLLKLKLWRDFMDSIFNWTLFVRFFCNFVFIFLTGLIGVPERRSFLLSKQKCGNRKSSITVERSES